MTSTKYAIGTMLIAASLLFAACENGDNEDIDPICGDNVITPS